MDEISFEAEIVGLCSDRKFPYGFEDKLYTEFEKDKRSTKKKIGAVVEENFLPVEKPDPRSKVTEEGETDERSKSNPLYRFVRTNSGEVDMDRVRDMIQSKIVGLLRSVAPFCGDGRTGGLSKPAKQTLSVHLEIVDSRLSEQPFYQLHGLVGGHGSQPTYFEAFEFMRIKGKIASFGPPGILQKLLVYADGQEIGAARIGKIHFRKVK